MPMEKSPETSANLEIALDAFAKGYTVIAMLAGTKIPAEKWNRWLTEPATAESIYQRWDGTDHGLALHCHNVLVVDVEDENLLDFVIEKCGRTEGICQTPGGGFHLPYRLRGNIELARQIKWKGKPIDLLTKNSLSIIPRSIGENGMPYRWIGAGLPPRQELPFANIGWTRERKRARTPQQVITSKGGRIRDILAYLLTIPSVQGQNGSKGCFRACCVLRDGGYTPLEAWPILLAWNEAKPVPPWSIPELIHKLESVYKVRLRGVLR